MARRDAAWVLGALLLVTGACKVRPEMCDAPSACGDKAICVANRCQARGALPALSKSRRFVLEPVDIAFIEWSSDAPPGALPTVVTLGRARSRSAALLLRWVAPVLYDAEVIEAYVVLDRVGELPADAPRVGLHAEQVMTGWDPRSASWATGPELADVNAPRLFLRAGAPTQLRIDVASIVRKWHEPGAEPHGVAIVADHWTERGASFAALPGEASPLPGDPEGHSPPAALGPRLELYVK